MTVLNFERVPEQPKQFTNDDLLRAFQQYKQKYGDVGLMLCAMFLEVLERNEALEQRLSRLEQRRK